MNHKTISLIIDERGIATLSLDRVEKHNAMSGEMIAELSDMVQLLANDNSVRVVVLTGKGKSFCAGGDLGWMRQQFEADRETRIAQAMKLASMLHALNELPKPLIGRINGQAFGGGIGLISICDIAVGIHSANFGFTETRLGLIPATISPYVLARMGEARARQFFMSGKIFSAQEAVKSGLLAISVADDELNTAVEEQIRPYLCAAPGAIARAKQLVRSLGPKIDKTTMLDTATRLADCWESAETQEGISAFLNKTKPSWQ